MDTRVNVFTLVDYQEFYGAPKTFADALNIIRNIPSVTLLNYISGFSVNLYLRENFEHSGKIQAYILDSILKKVPVEIREKWKGFLNESKDAGHSPVVIWNYSNLLFYELIFKRFNKLRSRKLNQREALNFFDAYLIINLLANDKIKIQEEELLAASQGSVIEEITVPGFIYQKDYVSTTDFANQVVRGVMLFEYLERHPKYGVVVQDYYLSKHVPGHLRMFKNLMTLFSQLKIDGSLSERNQLVHLAVPAESGEIDLAYIDSLCINAYIKEYVNDNSFGQLRKTFLYKWDKYLYFILDVNFLIDNFYKAQVFEFNSFLKTKGIKDEFLSIKAKEFMEGIYLPQLFRKCFVNKVVFHGSMCKNSKGEELCDLYMREGNKVCLIEFKDVLLNANAKNSGNRGVLFGELDKKFLENQKNKPKGITQLLNALDDIESNGILFDVNCPSDGLQVFPIVLYTDFSFGQDGINKVYRDKMHQKLNASSFSNIHINELTFINLIFFELHEEYLAGQYVDIFRMLRQYHHHIQDPEYRLTPFEVFSRFYLNEHIHIDLEEPDTYKQILQSIVSA